MPSTSPRAWGPSTGRSSTRRAPASASSTHARTCAGGTITYSVCTINRPENADVVDALGLPVEDLGAAWPEYRDARRPAFLLTLPHVHRTSGFFLARVRV